MKNQVKIALNTKTKEVITPSKNPEYGIIRVESTHVSFENEFINESKRSAFLRAPIEFLEAQNYKEGTVLPGIIQKLESFEPFYEGQNPKINPRTEEIVLTNGKPTYLRYVFTQVANAPADVWIDSTEVEAEAELDNQAV